MKFYGIILWYNNDMANKSSFKTYEEYLEYQRRYRAKNRKRIRAYNRVYNTNLRKKSNYLYDRKYKKSNPLKIRATNAIRYAVRNKKLIPKPCEVCGTRKSEAHHEDYSKPLEIIWLCSYHHHIADQNRRQKEDLSTV